MAITQEEFDRGVGKLPCGATAYKEQGYAWRCQDCLAIWGSVACKCSNDLKTENKKQNYEN